MLAAEERSYGMSQVDMRTLSEIPRQDGRLDAYLDPSGQPNKRSTSSPDLVSLEQADSSSPSRRSTAGTEAPPLRLPSASEDGLPQSGLMGSSLRRLSTQRDQWSDQELMSIAERMRGEIDVRERSKGFKRYAPCFLGTEAVAWMLNNRLVPTSEAAVRLGNELLRMGLLFHVSYKHPFRDKPYFYQFHSAGSSSESDAECFESANGDATRHERLYDSLWSRRNVASSDGSLRPVRKTVEERWKPATEINRLQRRLADQTAQLNELKEICGVMFDSTSRQLKTFGAVMRQYHELFIQGKSAHDHTAQQLQTLSQQHTWTLILLFSMCFLQLAHLPYMWAIPACILLCLILYHLYGPSHLPQWASKGLDDRQHSLHRPTEEFEMPLEIVSPFAVSTSAPAAISVQGSLDGETSSLGSPDNYARGDRDYGAPPPAQSDFEGWRDAPMLLRPKQLSDQVVQGLDRGRIPVNTSRHIEFESDLFKGCAVIYVAGLPSAPPGLFAGQRRRTAITVQGQFKRELSFEEVLTGQEFCRPAKQLPAKWLVETVLMSLARKISPSMVIGPLSAPHVLAPLVAMAQEINVAEPGSQPEPTGAVAEDMRAACPHLVDKNGEPMSMAGRKQHFWSQANRESAHFDTSHVWTFTLYQHFVDMSTYELNMVKKFDLSGHLDGQPLQFMMKHRGSEKYLFNFEAWHEKLLPAASQNRST